MNINSWWPTLRVIILALLVGGASGVLATSLTNNYLAEYTLRLEESILPLKLSQQRPQAFPQSYAEALVAAREKFLPAQAQFFTDSRVLPRVFPPEQAVAQGVVLT